MKTFRHVFLILLMTVLGCGQALVEFPTNMAPTVTLTDPADKAVAVALDTKVSAVFSKDMDVATLTLATFTVMHGTTLVPGTVTYANRVVTFAPTSGLSLGNLYTATLTTSVKDSADTPLTSNYVWTFTTSALPDRTAPTVTFTDPPGGASNVNASTKVQAAFDKTMSCATLTTATFTLMHGSTPVPGVVGCSGATTTFTPTNALAASTTFTATITTGAKDLAGNALASNYVWTFSTSSLLDVSFTSPGADANGVDSNATVQVGFNETMNCATLTGTTFTLLQGNTALPGTVTCAGPTATFTPTGALAANAAFTATITTGAKDLSGDTLVADYVWSFTTGSMLSVAAPTVTSNAPPNGAVNVAVNALVTATFDEAMNPATITGATFMVSDGTVAVAGNISYAGTTATFTPTANLPAGSLLTAAVTTGVTDLLGHPMAADFSWTFMTGTPPTVASTNPSNGASGVAINLAVSATFNGPMNPLTISSTTFTLSQTGMPVAGTVSYSNSTATFTPAANYPADTTLTAVITTGAKDTNGDALLQDYLWSFTTGTLQAAQGIVDLGAASSYAILAFNTVTNVNNPGTIVTGDLGISPGGALVGFPPGQVVGTIHAGDATAAAAKAALLTAYNDAAGRLGAAVLPGDLSGLTFPPGLYKNSTSVMLSTGNVTLDAQGDINAVFIFQMGSTLTTVAATQVLLVNGAQATNVFWAVGTSATLGTNSSFQGTILAGSAITMQTGASIVGRLLAQGAAVALDTNAITAP